VPADVMTGKPHVPPPPDNGGITVSAMNTGYVRILDNETKQGWELDAFRAMDIAQRMIEMSMLLLQKQMTELTEGHREHVPAVKLDIVRAPLPKNLRP
jgi:hypothetical protein